jgi:hypothetical protein
MRRRGRPAHELHAPGCKAAGRSAAGASSRDHADGSANKDRRSGHHARNSEADQEHPKHDDLERWGESQSTGLLTTF